MQETRRNCFGSKNITRPSSSFKPIFLIIVLSKFNFSIAFSFEHCCYFSALVLIYCRLMKGRVTFFRPETIVASSFHRMVLISKVFTIYFSKRSCVVLLISEYQTPKLVTFAWTRIHNGNGHENMEWIFITNAFI